MANFNKAKIKKLYLPTAHGTRKGHGNKPTLVTANASELNIMDGVTATAAELNYLDIASLGTGVASKAVVLDSGDDYTWPAAGVLTYGVLADASTTLGATAAELNMAADNSANAVVITADPTITAADSGKTFFLNNATGFDTALPAPALGLRFRFIVGATAPTSGNHTLTTASNATVIFGSFSTAADGTACGIGATEDTISFVASTAITGDMVDIISDGTNWYTQGQCAVATAITSTDEA